MNQHLPSGDSVDSPACKWPLLFGGLAALSLLLLGSGCSTAEMKGTPFYTGEYSKRTGAAEQRVNVWPLLFYREPALSVAWPIFELTDDHTAIRPLFSVYGLDQPEHQYNFFWPLAQFDWRTEDYRIFPLFWGDDYRVLFPLCWHFGQPWGGPEGSDTLFPLWHYSRKGTERFNLYSPWPLVRNWSDQKDDVRGSMVVPLYYHRTQGAGAQFYSPLWCHEQKPDGDFWRMLFPLYFESQLDDHASLLTPLWQHGNSRSNEWHSMMPFWFYSSAGDQAYDLSAPWPLVRFWSATEKDNHGSRVLPLYWHEQNAGRTQFYSLLWMNYSKANGDYWRLLPPLFYQDSTRAGSRLVTPLWAQGKTATNDWRWVVPLVYWDTQQHTLLSPLWLQWQEGETKTAVAPWLLSWRTREPERTDLWLAGGLARASWGEKPGADYVVPLFYRDTNGLFTPLFGWDEEADFLYYATPLAGVRTGAHSGSWLFPLYHQTRVKATGEMKANYLLLGSHTKTKERSRSRLIPLFYYENQFEPESVVASTNRDSTYGKNFWCLPVCWYRNECHLRPIRNHGNPTTEIESTAWLASATTNGPVVRDYTRTHGVFPLWDYESHATPAEGRSNQEGSLLLWLYDYKHDYGPLPGARASGTNDHTRSRVLWRLWHYEKLNGNVSVDVFPSFTYDRKTDGFKKISFLWRFFRYERSADGETKLDALFVPLKR